MEAHSSRPPGINEATMQLDSARVCTDTRKTPTHGEARPFENRSRTQDT